MNKQTRTKATIFALTVFTTMMLVASQASAQGRAETAQVGQSAVGLTVLSSTVSVARVLGMPEHMQAAVLEVAEHLDSGASGDTATESESDDEFVPASADEQSELENQALAALDRGEPVDNDRETNRRDRRDERAGSTRDDETDADADLGNHSEPETVEGVIEQHQHEIVGCYRERLSAKPRLKGSLTVKFIVEKDGSVAAPVIENSSLNDENVESCITNTVRRLEFPEPVSNQRTVWKFPFQFRAGR